MGDAYVMTRTALVFIAGFSLIACSERRSLPETSREHRGIAIAPIAVAEPSASTSPPLLPSRRSDEPDACRCIVGDPLCSCLTDAAP